MFSGERVGVLTNLPTHYRLPLFASIARRIGAAGGELRVFFSESRFGTREYLHGGEPGFPHEYLRALHVPGAGTAPLDLETRLASYSPTILLAPGFSPLVSGRAARFARRSGVPFGLWSGEPPHAPTAASRSRRLQRVALVRKAGFAIAYGGLAAAYLRSLAPRLPLVVGRNTTPVRAPALRAGTGPLSALAVSQAIPRKGLDTVIDAFRLVPAEVATLTVIGDGSALPRLRERARGLGHVRLAGAVASAAIAEEYARAELFLFPTRFDVFGLTLVEAMASGIPTIASSAAGAVYDLADPGQNAEILEPGGPVSWAGAVNRLAGDQRERDRMGAAARATIESRWTVQHAADSMVAGLRLGLMRTGAPE
ncbi:MAG: glycosyltransferase family 4 protein [Thermoleophilaceae bacterium]|nr:glycosyltransferase family 4 protein [Thermoleophilaceae bacterium]